MSDNMPVMKAVEQATGKKFGYATIWRWVRKGVRINDGTRVCLEVDQIGGRVFTTVEKVVAFNDRVAIGRGLKKEVRLRTPKQRQAAYDRAKKECEKLGLHF